MTHIPLFDGALFRYALRRTVGVEMVTNECHLCQMAPGGTLHGRFCVAKEIKGQCTIVHHALVRALAGLLRRYLAVPVSLESHVPFVLGGVKQDAAKHMDIVLPFGAFVEDGEGAELRGEGAERGRGGAGGVHESTCLT